MMHRGTHGFSQCANVTYRQLMGLGMRASGGVNQNVSYMQGMQVSTANRRAEATSSHHHTQKLSGDTYQPFYSPMPTKEEGSSFPGTSGSPSQEVRKGCLISSRKLKVTLLSCEWGSTEGGLSTINRELAIQLAKNDNVEVSMYVPQCSEEDERAAAGFSVCLLKAKKKPGYDPIDWLASIPRDHRMDVVIGHGIHLGRQVPMIKDLLPDCKWIQVVHTDPEELGMFKDYASSTLKGAKKHQAEVELCKLADQVVAVGPKLTEAFSCYLRSCEKDQGVINLTPGIFSEFANINQATEERETFRVLVFGCSDREDFHVKGYDIAAHAVAKLKDEEHSFKLVFVGAPDGEEREVKERFLKEGILPSQLIVRSAKDREQLAKQFYEADLVIMPSRTEGFGLAALEALSAGLPVLVSCNSGIGKALKKVPFGLNCVINSENPKTWAKAIRAVCSRERKLRLEEANLICKSYAAMYQWEGQCSTLVEKMLEMIRGTSTAPDEAVVAVNLGEQGPRSISEAVFHPDLTTSQQLLAGDLLTSGRRNGKKSKKARISESILRNDGLFHPDLTTSQQLLAGDLLTSGRRNGKKSKKARISESILLNDGLFHPDLTTSQQLLAGDLLTSGSRIETSTAPDEALVAVNLGQKGPRLISEAMFRPDVTTSQQLLAGDLLTSGRRNENDRNRPSNPFVTATVERQRWNPYIPRSRIRSNGCFRRR